MKVIDRRKLLQMAGVAAAGLAINAGARERAQGAEPATRRQKAESGKDTRLLIGCCAISYSKYLRNGQMSMEDFIRKGVELHLDGVDITVYFLKSSEPAYLASLRHLAFKNGISFSGAACGASMLQADKAKRAQVLEEIKKWTEVTDQLGAPHLRVFAGKLPPDTTTEQGVGWCAEVMKAASDYAGKRGITLGLEPHSGITQRADTLLEIIRRVDSSYAGINLDITHFVPTAEQDGYAQIEACIPYATQTHIRYRFDSGEVIDLDRVWQMFAKGAYKGYMSAEYENEKEDAITGVPRLIGDMRKLSRKYSSV